MSLGPRSTRPPAIVLSRVLTGLATVRALHAAGVSVHAFVFADGDLTLSTRCERKVLVPRHARQGEALVAFIEAYVAELPPELGKPILIPISDQHALLLAEHQDRLRRCTRLWGTEAGALREIISKDGLYALAERAGVPRIPSIAEPDRAALASWVQQHPGPYLLKPFYAGVQGVRLKRKNLVIETAPQLIAYVAEHGAKSLIVQRLLKGGDGYIFDTYGLCDAQGRLVQVATHRRWRQAEPDFGMTSFGEIPSGLPPEQDQRLIDQTEALLAATRFHGIFGIEWLLDRATGTCHVIDFNARPFLSIGHLRDCGMNLPYLAYQDLTEGLPTDLPRVPALRRLWWIDLKRDLQTLRAVRARGELSLWSWLVSVSKVRSLAYFDWRDPMPGLLQGRQLVRDLLSLSSKKRRSWAQALQERVEQGQPSAWRTVVKTALQFGVTGPAEALIPWMALVFIAGGSVLFSLAPHHPAVLVFVLALALSYLVSLAPATLTGAIAGLWRGRVGRRQWMLRSSLVGFVVAVLLAVILIEWRHGLNHQPRWWLHALTYGVPGALGALMSAALLGMAEPVSDPELEPETDL